MDTIPLNLNFLTDGPIAVLAPHPDDESLGCGGLLAQAFKGNGAHVICLTDGSGSHPGSSDWPADRLAATRHDELLAAIRCLGGLPKDLTWLGLPDSMLCHADLTHVAADIADTITKCGARHVFAPALEDHHADHKATARIAQEVRRQKSELQFYSYPVWSRWDDPEFDQSIACRTPCFFETEAYREQKRAAIEAHRSQLGKVVKDDPCGFVLPPAFVEKFVVEDEIFWRTP